MRPNTDGRDDSLPIAVDPHHTSTFLRAIQRNGFSENRGFCESINI